MTDSDPVRIEGVGELARTLRAAGESLDDLKDANQTASRIVLEEARSRAPKRTGALAASGRVNRAAKKANVIFGSAKVPYASAIHWGWPSHNLKANPFGTTAAERTQPVWLAAYEKNLQQLLDDVKGD